MRELRLSQDSAIIKMDYSANLQMSIKVFFRYQFTACAFYLLFVFQPLDFLFRIDSFLISMNLREFVVSYAALCLILALVSLLLAIFAVIIAIPTRYLFGGAAVQRIYQATCVTVLFLALYSFSKSLKIWANSIHLPLPGKVIIIAAFFFAALLFFWRASMYARVHSILMSVKRLPGAAIVVAGLLTITNVLFVEFTYKPVLKATTSTVKKLPDIILVTFDALAANDMSLYGYSLSTTPNISEFARSCTVYNNAFSTSNTTLFAVSSLMTGMYPVNNGLRGLNTYNRLSPEIAANSLPALLQQAGYRTYAAVAVSDFAHPKALGLSRYFDKAPLDYVDWENVPVFYWPGQISLILRHFGGLACSERYGINSFLWLSEYLRENLHTFGEMIGKTYTEPLFPPEKVVSGVRELIQAHKAESGANPFFVWIHFFPPHSPYLPGEGYKYKFFGDKTTFSDFKSLIPFTDRSYGIEHQPLINKLRFRYDENIAYADAGFGKLIQTLKQSEIFEDSLMIVAADHGQSFSHGYVGHGGSQLTQLLIRIPILVKTPGEKFGSRSDAPVSLIDIPPTILTYAGQKVPLQMQGVSLQSARESDRVILSMVPESVEDAKSSIKSAAIVKMPYKLYYDARTGNSQLFNIVIDPDEISDLALSEKNMKDILQKELASSVSIPKN